MSPLIELQKWYRANCNNDWEHSYGISICTLDNPGWTLKIDLKDTPLENKSFDPRDIDYESDAEWMTCKNENKQFISAGGPEKLEDMIKVFLDWARDD